VDASFSNFQPGYMRGARCQQLEQAAAAVVSRDAPRFDSQSGSIPPLSHTTIRMVLNLVLLRTAFHR
jgi:hypothetical protein